MNKKDWIFLFVFIQPLLFLVLSWDIEFEKREWNQVCYILLVLCSFVPVVYFVWRVCSKFRKSKLITSISLIVVLLIGGFIVVNTMWYSPAMKGTYLLLYSNPQDTNETIEIVWNHKYLHNWNEIKRIKNYPALGISIRKDFEQKELNGQWIVHEENPYCKSIGKAWFKDGVLEKNK